MDRVSIGMGGVVCYGTYVGSTCTPSSVTGTAINFLKHNAIRGTVTLRNAGSIWGDIGVSAGNVGASVRNMGTGHIRGHFVAAAGTTGVDNIINEGTWRLFGTSEFRGGSDTVRNRGTLVIEHSGTSIVLNDLENFILEGTGLVRFSLADTSPSGTLLDIGDATPTLGGLIELSIRDGNPIPISGTISLISGTKLLSSIDINNLYLTGASGALFISNGDLLLRFTPPLGTSVPTPCGPSESRTPLSPGVANRQAVCSVLDGFSAIENIVFTQDKFAILYRGTQADALGSVNNISNTGRGGEIHILSGSVARADDETATSGDAIVLSHAGADPLRLVTNFGTLISNADPTSGSDAIFVSGGGGVFLSVAGSTSAEAGYGIFAQAAGTGDIDIDVRGGTHTSKQKILGATISSSSPTTGGIDIDITGDSTVLFSTNRVVEITGGNGADKLDIGVGAVVCRGTYSAGTCTPSAGDAIFVSKSSAASGSIQIIVLGNLYGDISIGSGNFGVVVTNKSQGRVVGDFTSSSNGITAFRNEGTWTTSSSLTFGSSTSDGFTNSGTFVMEHSGSTLAMNNLEIFTLQETSILRFSLADNSVPSTALLDIGGATPLLSGIISLTTRDSSTMPTSGTITLITGTALTNSVDLSRLSISGAFGALVVSNNNLVLSFSGPAVSTPCGTTVARIPVSPGFANREIVCDQADSLTTSSSLAFSNDRVAVLYRGTAVGGSGAINTLSHTGRGGEVHILSGSISTASGSGSPDSLSLSSSGIEPLRLVVSAGTSVSNADTTSGSDAIFVSGGRNVFLNVAGSTSAEAGNAIYAQAGGTGSVTVAISGGTHRSKSKTLVAGLSNTSTGALDIDFSGSAVLVSSGTVVIETSGSGNSQDTLDITSGVVVCSGAYSGGTCTQGNGMAVSFGKGGASGGSVAFTNGGRIWGTVSASALTGTSSIINRSSGIIVGAFAGGSGNDAVSNAGTWTIAQNFDFGGGTDSFTNSGTFIVHYDSTTLAMNNLETLTLNSGGTLQFSLGSTTLPTVALLNVGGCQRDLCRSNQRDSARSCERSHFWVAHLDCGYESS